MRRSTFVSTGASTLHSHTKAPPNNFSASSSGRRIALGEHVGQSLFADYLLVEDSTEGRVKSTSSWLEGLRNRLRVDPG